MQPKSFKKNYFYNLIFTFLNMIFPLLTAPYLSRVLGVENIGRVNYAVTIVNWFIVFSSFGIPRYGLREIARKRNDRKDLSCCFWNLINIQIFFSIIAMLAYLILILNSSIFKSDLLLYLIMVIQIFLNIFSIDWFFYGIEEYGYITLRNFIIKLLSILFMYIMIKSSKDYILYAFLNIIGLSLNNILNFVHAKKYIDKKPKNFSYIHYIKELRIYFFTTLIISLYTQFDQVIIGIISQKDLAYYIRSKTFYSIANGIVNSIICVLVPRMTYLAYSNYEEYRVMLKKSIMYIYLLAIPCTVGLFILSEELMVLFGGNEFLPASNCLKLLSFQIIIISINTFLGQQVFLPNRLEHITFKFQCAVAIISLILNMILIPRYSYMGAAIAWILAELLLMIIEIIYIKLFLSDLRVNYINFSSLKYIISSIIMGSILVLLKNIKIGLLTKIILIVFVGTIIYFILLIIMKEDTLLNSIKQIKNRNNKLC